MPLLALNTIAPQSMKGKYQLAVGILPIGLTFAAFLPIWHLAGWLASYFGIPANSPLREHPNASAWVAAFLFTTIALMILGYVIGWVINAAVSRYVLGWSKEKVRAVYLQSKLPTHWLKEGVSESQSADKQSIAEWEAQRKVGALRFVAMRGVLAWGGPMLLAMHVVPTLIKGQGFSLEDSLFNVGLWAFAGASFGAIIWYSSEANYRKLKKRNESDELKG